MPYIELHRMITGYESAVILVDEETMKQISNKEITREELNDLFQTSDDFDLDVTESGYPHTAYKINPGGYPDVYSYEDLPE